MICINIYTFILTILAGLAHWAHGIQFAERECYHAAGRSRRSAQTLQESLVSPHLLLLSII